MKEKILNIFKSPILKNLILAIVLVFVVLIILSLYLKSYTHHGKEIFTPSFKGMNIAEAQELANEKDLKIVIIDSLYSDYANPGEVMDQTPKANFKVKKGRTIFVTIRAYSQKMVKMPFVIARSLIQARSMIETAGLRIGQITYVKSDQEYVKQQLYQGKEIEEGIEIPEGSVIDLVVGSKQGSVAYVPDLLNLTEKDASFKLAEYSLNIGNIIYDQNVITKADSLNATVYKQSINKDITVEPGTKIDIWLK